MEPTTTGTTPQEHSTIASARDLLQSSSALLGDQADALRVDAIQEAIRLLDKVLTQGAPVPLISSAAAVSKAAADSANRYVKKNPWRMMGATAGLSVLLGLIVARRKTQRHES